jgi:hypothetical protein
MPDYLQGKIYHIIAPNGAKYVGSTTQSLTKRFIAHKTRYKSWKDGKYKYLITCFKIFEEHGIENCKIELIEEFPCNSKKQLETREGEIIQTVDCVNKVIAGRGKDKWVEEHKDCLQKYWKQYYIDNLAKYT